jgi:flavin-binding protein dodecin
MSDISKVIEVVGTSATSVEDAIQGAIDRTSKTVNHLQWFEVKEVRGHIVNQTVDRYQVLLRIGFGIES